MKYPAFNEYQAALQHPTRCFEAPELIRCSVETDLWGLPRVRSGGFALTYKLMDGDHQYAVRCFHRHVDDRADRYFAINQFLRLNNLEFLEKIQYYPKGIIIKGNHFPITCMEWVDGEPLETYIIRHLKEKDVLEEILGNFQQLILDLEKNGVAHGDLSHHNIMVKQGKLFLVDYDGMFVPGMNQKKSCEIGNPHFQHPGRDENIFNPTTDRFSSIVIYMAVKTLAIDPSFWYRYETGGEGLLFSRSDFENPYQSPLMQEMDTISSLRKDVKLFREICNSDVIQTPRLDDFIHGTISDLPRSENRVDTTIASQSPLVFDAQRKFLFMSHLGEFVSIIGKIDEVFNGKARDNVPHIFLNFGNWKAKCFTVVLWDEALNLMVNSGISPDDYLGKWVRVTGMLTAYRRRPQIVVNTPYDIEIMDEDRASDCLKLASGNYFRMGTSHPEPKLNAPVIIHPALLSKDDLGIGKPHAAEISGLITNPLDLSAELRGAVNTLFEKHQPDQDKS